MEDEANSWIRRTKFSHTVCHRLDSARLASFLSDIQPNQIAGVKTRPPKTFLEPQPELRSPKIQTNPVTNKYRTVTPPPKTSVPDTFKEARSNTKRFSTPHPQRVETEKGVKGKRMIQRNMTAVDLRSPPNGTSPLRQFNSMKIHDKRKMKRDYSWSKLFDHGGGKVISVETVDDVMVDLSKLFLGHRFAHGAHSQLYHGIYKEEAVAVKIIRVPDDDEHEELGVRLENQFIREVNLLSRLHHQNVIKVQIFRFLVRFLSHKSCHRFI